MTHNPRMTMRTAKQRREYDEDLERQHREELRSLIEQQVRQRLSEANGPQSVQVRRLWEDHYRVNVLIGTPATTTRVSDSFFVEADSDGRIVESNPAIANLGSTR